jgi:hypothetical protein
MRLPLTKLVIALLLIGNSLLFELPAAASGERILVFSRTTGFRHASIPNGIAAIQQLVSQNSFQVTTTEDPAFFNDATLAQYRAVVFLMTTGDILDATTARAFGRPDLAVVHEDDQLQLRWPTVPDGFALEYALTPDGMWMPVTDSPTVIQGVKTLTVQIGPDNRFYRLNRH